MTAMITKSFKKGLIERTERNHRQWWKVRFNQVEGPKPELRLFTVSTKSLTELPTTAAISFSTRNTATRHHNHLQQ